MSTDTVVHVVGGLVALGLFLLILFEIYKYVKGHPAQVAALEARVKAAEAKLEATASSDLAEIKAGVQTIKTQLGMVHTAVVTGAVAAPPAPASAAPVTGTAP